jgi:hypothetical protein
VASKTGGVRQASLEGMTFRPYTAGRSHPERPAITSPSRRVRHTCALPAERPNAPALRWSCLDCGRSYTWAVRHIQGGRYEQWWASIEDLIDLLDQARALHDDHPNPPRDSSADPGKADMPGFVGGLTWLAARAVDAARQSSKLVS